jgi:peptidoglycan hydrolase-like protein with peptidoglycan-binding domain
MGLRSNFLSGDPALEACLVQDSAHVTQGAVGDHVAKIQAALNLTAGLEIDPSERNLQRYGPSTAAAVLQYKTARNIVNLTYQTQPDNIVGKMTIAALDNDMVQLESSLVVLENRCSFASGLRPRLIS